MTQHELSQYYALLDDHSDFIEGSLSLEPCEEIIHHVAECHNCQIFEDTHRKMASIYHENAPENGAMSVIVRARLFRSLNLDKFISN